MIGGKDGGIKEGLKEELKMFLGNFLLSLKMEAQEKERLYAEFRKFNVHLYDIMKSSAATLQNKASKITRGEAIFFYIGLHYIVRCFYYFVHLPVSKYE